MTTILVTYSSYKIKKTQKSILSGNLNSSLSYLITTVKTGAKETEILYNTYPFFFLQPSDGGNVTSSTLRFQPKVSDMGKVLRCRAENPVMPASQIEDAWSLDINCK